MPVNDLLSRLTKVKPRGKGRWMACCPAHGDKSPSLSIRETQDGRVLLHCWVGCGAADILDAIGLDFAALFPETEEHHKPRERQPFSPRDALSALSVEVGYLAAFVRQAKAGKVTEQDRQRMLTCAQRIIAAESYCDGL